MLKKSGIILSSCNNLHSFGPAASSSTSPPPHSQCRTSPQCRPYAMMPNGHSRHNHGGIRWPEVSTSKGIPTPYQIFNLKKGSPYSKRRFYELVKMYHPDRHDQDFSNGNLSYATKLERYRLIVAANEILCDPIKRGAYDTYGAGWNGAPDVTRPGDPSDPASTWGNTGGRGWAGGPEGPSGNATWEDWERWYQRGAKGPQEPAFVSNGAFVWLILIFATLGGIGQATRAGNSSMTLIEARDAVHDKSSKDLMRRRREATTKFGSREERITEFLRQRDPLGFGISDPSEDRFRRLLPPPEVCSSEDINGRDMGAYHSKNGPSSK